MISGLGLNPFYHPVQYYSIQNAEFAFAYKSSYLAVVAATQKPAVHEMYRQVLFRFDQLGIFWH